ncbi:hypothetical protein AB0T83_12125 [Fluviibacterium sp. DFM31]|uniref:ABC transporter substrate-binding protein n=1 Tax=Meridianimarinicoccus marinus TaxID=3231483 RepID=A0ABV3L7H1_9RHOB
MMLAGMTWDHARAYDCLVAASERFAAERGTAISWKKRSLQAFADEPIEQIARAYDLVILDHPHVGQISASGCLLELPDFPDPAATSLGGSVESYIWNSKTWSYPIDAACQMAVVRADLGGAFPAHWEDVLEDAGRFSLVTPLLPVDAFDLMLSMLASRGEADLPVSPQAFCSEANGLFNLKVLKALFRMGPSEATDWNPIRVLELLSTSNDFAGSPALFGYINYARPGFRPHQLTYHNLPGFRGHGMPRGILGGAGIGVSAFCAHPEEAIAFAQWVTSEPIQSSVYIENEGQPAHLGTWNRLRHTPRYAGFLDGAYDTITHAWTRPRDDWFLHFVDDICEIFPAFFLKDRAEEDMLADINALYRKHIGQEAQP